MANEVVPFYKNAAHEIFQQVLMILTTADVILHVYCTFLIVRVSTQPMRQYRRFMLFSAICDICFVVTLGYLLQPRIMVSTVFACYSVQSFLHLLGDSAAPFPYSTTYFFGALVLGSQYYSLVYRMIQISNNTFLKDNFTRPILTVPCVFLCVSIPATVGAAHYFTHFDSGTTQSIKMKAVKLGYMADESGAVSCVYVSAYFYVVTVATFLLFATAEAIFLSCAAWTIWKVNRHEAFTSRTKAMHAQLTRLLIAQMLSPIVCMFVPVAVITLTGYFGLAENVSFMYFSLLGLSLFPTTDAVLTVVFVTPYRRFTLDLFRRVARVSPADFSSSVRTPARERNSSTVL